MSRIIYNVSLISNLLIVIMIITGCFSEGMCGNTIISEEKSPNGEYIAYVFVRDCGATTDYSTQVTVLKEGIKFNNRIGNTFVCEGEETIEVDWNDDNELVVHSSLSKDKITKQKKKVYNIKIKYQ